MHFTFVYLPFFNIIIFQNQDVVSTNKAIFTMHHNINNRCEEKKNKYD